MLAETVGAEMSNTAPASAEQTTPDVAEDTQPVSGAGVKAVDTVSEGQTTEETTQEPEITETETTVETDEEGEKQFSQSPDGEKVTDWEKIAKDNQASFTKISQEKAELTKRIEELEFYYGILKQCKKGIDIIQDI